LNIVSLQDRPELAPTVAGWLLDEFRHHRSPPLETIVARLVAQRPPQQTYVLFDGSEAVGTSSLVLNDLPTRPDLTPWLASVVVCPGFRGRGYSAPLVRHVEIAAAASADALWLYTWTAERLYARLGWEHVGWERDPDRNIDVVLMRRDLTSDHKRHNLSAR
jgi:GNAT superfamily N-acetyltransferase